MKKSLLFALIGGVIIFVWQFISFAIPNFHKSRMEYSPVQDEVLAAIEKSGMKEGMYMLGQPSSLGYSWIGRPQNGLKFGDLHYGCCFFLGFFGYQNFNSYLR